MTDPAIFKRDFEDLTKAGHSPVCQPLSNLCRGNKSSKPPHRDPRQPWSKLEASHLLQRQRDVFQRRRRLVQRNVRPPLNLLAGQLAIASAQTDRAQQVVSQRPPLVICKSSVWSVAESLGGLFLTLSENMGSCRTKNRLDRMSESSCGLAVGHVVVFLQADSNPSSRLLS